MWRGGQIVTSDSNLVACIQLKRNNFPSETEEKIVFRCCWNKSVGLLNSLSICIIFSNLIRRRSIPGQWLQF